MAPRNQRDTVASIIIERIEASQPGYCPGDFLPNTRTLAAQFGVSQSTIVRVCKYLADEDWLLPHQRRWCIADLHAPRPFARVSSLDDSDNVQTYIELLWAVCCLAALGRKLPEQKANITQLWALYPDRTKIAPPGFNLIKKRTAAIRQFFAAYPKALQSPFLDWIFHRIERKLNSHAEPYFKSTFPLFLHDRYKAPIASKFLDGILCDDVRERQKTSACLHFVADCFPDPAPPINGYHRSFFFRSPSPIGLCDLDRFPLFASFKPTSSNRAADNFADSLRRLIIVGEPPFVPGTKAPSGRSLEKHASRTTVQLAMAMLRHEGWLIPSSQGDIVGPKDLFVDEQCFDHISATPTDGYVIFGLLCLLQYQIESRLFELAPQCRQQAFAVCAPILASLNTNYQCWSQCFEETGTVPFISLFQTIERFHGLLALAARAPLLAEIIIHLCAYARTRLAEHFHLIFTYNYYCKIQRDWSMLLRRLIWFDKNEHSTYDPYRTLTDFETHPLYAIGKQFSNDPLSSGNPNNNPAI